MATTINLSDPIATWVTKTNTISSDLGTKASLNTTNKSSLVAAINELKTQSEKTDSSTILQLIDANNYLDSSRVDSLIPKRGTDFVDSAISNGLFDTRLASKTTADLTEGSNLYFTTTRARQAISASGSVSYNNSTGVISFTQGNTDTVSEGGSNLYFTDTRARAAISGGTGISYNSSTGAITNSGVTSLTGGTRITVTGGTGGVTINNAITAGSGLSFNGNQLKMNNGAIASSSSNAHDNNSSGTVTSYTAGSYPVFIAGRSYNSGDRLFQLRIGGVEREIDMRDGDNGTYDTFATFLPPNSRIRQSGNLHFYYMAVRLIPA